MSVKITIEGGGIGSGKTALQNIIAAYLSHLKQMILCTEVVDGVTKEVDFSKAVDPKHTLSDSRAIEIRVITK